MQSKRDVEHKAPFSL